jgi:anti-sigma factor RsiW
MSNEHPIEFIPAYVLGVLDESETARITEHLANCPACQQEAEECRRLLNAPDGPLPRPHVKRRVFERRSELSRSRARACAHAWRRS